MGDTPIQDAETIALKLKISKILEDGHTKEIETSKYTDSKGDIVKMQIKETVKELKVDDYAKIYEIVNKIREIEENNRMIQQLGG